MMFHFVKLSQLTHFAALFTLISPWTLYACCFLLRLQKSDTGVERFWPCKHEELRCMEGKVPGDVKADGMRGENVLQTGDVKIRDSEEGLSGGEVPPLPRDF